MSHRDDGAEDGERLMRDASTANSEATASIDIRVADAASAVVFDAASVVDGIATESSPVIVARVAVAPPNITQVFDAGVDPSATTDRLHDDSPMLPERSDHNDYHA